jgi:hypothetical protein
MSVGRRSLNRAGRPLTAIGAPALEPRATAGAKRVSVAWVVDGAATVRSVFPLE